jgi:hypothetical protein
VKAWKFSKQRHLFCGFFGGFGIFFIGCAFLWWCSLYAKLNLPKQKKN